MITSKIIADSVNPTGSRLTTFILEYPRFIHAEVMTHRVFSKNAASSRAIPIEKMIQQIIDNPAMPTFWGKNQSGMQAAEELDNSHTFYQDMDGDILFENELTESLQVCRSVPTLNTTKEIWLEARDEAIKYAKRLNKLGLHKQICNRILEPWFNIRIILSGTEFENFFALRAHPDAQPEFQVLAKLMLDQYNEADPKQLKVGEWHIPFGDKIEMDRLNQFYDDGSGMVSMSIEELRKMREELSIKIAIARCARVSYLNYDGKDDYFADVKLCDRLFGSIPRHLSPTEHVAQALPDNGFSGNFSGFKQYRKFFTDENLKDSRVKKGKKA